MRVCVREIAHRLLSTRYKIDTAYVSVRSFREGLRCYGSFGLATSASNLSSGEDKNILFKNSSSQLNKEMFAFFFFKEKQRDQYVWKQFR